jgi:uncharacterized protein
MPTSLAPQMLTVLITGASSGIGAALAHCFDAARHQQLIDLKVSGLTAMLAAFVPAMSARGHGRVLNVASIAAFQPLPGLATHAATKACVLSLSKSLCRKLI